MKFPLLTLILLITFHAHAQFGVESIVDTTIYGSSISDIHITDMNNDGYQDLVISDNGGLGRVSIYLNDSFGAFGNESVLSNNKYQYLAIGIGDFDRNGLKDVIAISKFGKLTRFLQITAGQFTQTDIFSGIFFPLDVITTDLNKDGYMDFVSLGDRSILAFTNDSSGNFDTTNVASFTEFYSFCVGDVNSDGYPDLLAGSGRLYTFMNDGNGLLVKDTINETLNVPTLIHECEMADMDGDKDLDVVIYYTNVYDKVDWYSNNGSGKFKKESTITSLANNIHDLNIGDIDMDSKPDICLSYDQVSDLVWIKNQGNGIFSSEKAINSNAVYAFYAELGDLDNDGDLDLCHSANDGLFYYINNTTALSIKDDKEMNVTWYPNPSSGSINIELGKIVAVELNILNALGQVVLVREFKNLENIVLEIPGPKGIYFIELITDEGDYSILKVVKQ
jgi:hypothetical protein